MSGRSWVEGPVDVNDEHIVLSYGDDPTPVAWLARHDHTGFIVHFNTDSAAQAGRGAVTRELDDALNGADDGDRWREAIRRCGIEANGERPVHWSYFPLEPIFDGNGSGSE